jgi:hypothetical protein
MVGLFGVVVSSISRLSRVVVFLIRILIFAISSIPVDLLCYTDSTVSDFKESSYISFIFIS